MGRHMSSSILHPPVQEEQGQQATKKKQCQEDETSYQKHPHSYIVRSRGEQMNHAQHVVSSMVA